MSTYINYLGLRCLQSGEQEYNFSPFKVFPFILLLLCFILSLSLSLSLFNVSMHYRLQLTETESSELSQVRLLFLLFTDGVQGTTIANAPLGACEV